VKKIGKKIVKKSGKKSGKGTTSVVPFRCS